ncbi:MAG: CopG family transcriptional regulator [Methylomarinum sp.]|nr:CopG family transcriptional regulator [Methylomarinum sp.]
MSMHIETNIPDELWKQAQNMVEQGWVKNMDSLITESIRRYIEFHQQTTSGTFIREDVDWGLYGDD